MEGIRRFAANATMALTAAGTVGLAAWFVLGHLASTPPPPQLIANPGNEHVTLQWTIGAADYDESDVTRWEYQQYQLRQDGAGGHGWRSIPKAAAAAGRLRVGNLTNGWTYAFRVRARNENGPGAVSNEAIAVPEAPEAGPAVMVTVLDDERIEIRLPPMDPAIEEHLAGIEEHLAELRVREGLDLSSLETPLGDIADRLAAMGEGPGLAPLETALAGIADRLAGMGEGPDLSSLETALGDIADRLAGMGEGPDLSSLTAAVAGIANRLDGIGEGLDLAPLETALADIADRLDAAGVTERTALLPVHLLVHFRNAQLSGADGDLGDEGIVLEPAHRTMLRGTVDALAECAAQGSPVTVTPYGFASSAPFVGRDDTDALNVQVANGRADAVHDELVRLSAGRPNLSIQDPTEWTTFEDMVAARDACVESPSGARASGSFLDRVVVLDLQNTGKCAAEGWTASIRCSTPEVAGP